MALSSGAMSSMFDPVRSLSVAVTGTVSEADDQARGATTLATTMPQGEPIVMGRTSQ